MKAPTRGQRLRYTMGGRLPLDRRTWVMQDLTTKGWRWRAMGRASLQTLPFAVLLALLPGPAWIHVAVPLLLVVSVAFVTAAYGDDIRDRRLAQHGLPVPEREPPPRGF